MQEVRRIKSSIQPDTIEYLGDGSYYYNYDIIPYIEENSFDNGTMYSYIQVMLHGKPNYAECVRAIIRKYVSIDDEFDIINTANRHIKAKEATTEYDEYLALIDNIKNKVRQDFNK